MAMWEDGCHDFIAVSNQRLSERIDKIFGPSINQQTRARCPLLGTNNFDSFLATAVLGQKAACSAISTMKSSTKLSEPLCVRPWNPAVALAESCGAQPRSTKFDKCWYFS